MKTVFYPIISFLLLTTCKPKFSSVKVYSIDNNIETIIKTNERNELIYNISYKDDKLILDSSLGLNIDKVNLGDGVTIHSVQKTTINEVFPWIGNQDTIHSSYNESKLELYHETTKTKYFLEVRNFNNGVAFRYVVPSKGVKTIYNENTSFTFPDRTRVWYASGPFEYGWLQEFQDRETSEIEGELLAPPATFKLENNKGYVAISEANLYNFHGAVLLGSSPNTVKIGFVDNEEHVLTGKKIGVPKLKKYWHSVVKDVSWKQKDTIITPWRVMMYGKDLNDLVNNNIPAMVNPAPDNTLFADGVNSDWIKPGKSLWTWLSERHQDIKSTPEIYARYINEANKLNIEYVTIDEGWYSWKEANKNNWDIVSELTTAANNKNVGIWLWKSCSERKGIPGLDNVDFRKAFMKKCKDAGVKGLKIDFFHTENKYAVDLMEDILIEAAKNQLLIVFHGVNKPTGESRTYPNLLTKEAVRGLECVGGEDTWAPGPSWLYHNTVLPFTRLLAGPADYTPLHFGKWKPEETTMAHQIASTFMFSAPLTFFAADPEDISSSKAKDLITNVPLYWDEIKALKGSVIGEIAIFAKRKRNDWYIIILNGRKAIDVEVPLDFIERGVYDVEVVKDNLLEENIEVENKSIDSSKPFRVKLLSGGGLLVKIQNTNKLNS